MALIVWNDTFSVHIQEIDAQHHKLVDLINDLHEAMRTGQGKAALGSILDALVEYVKTHFATEESLFAAHNYPGMMAHTAEHTAFTQKVTDFQKQYQLGKLGLSLEVMNFLKEWLIHHIQETDKMYSQFLNQRGVAISPNTPLISSHHL